MNIVGLALAGEVTLAAARLQQIEAARVWVGVPALELLLRSLECHVRWSCLDLPACAISHDKPWAG
jgi:hypothetical protein